MTTLLLAILLAANPKIDMAAYLKVANEAAAHRDTRRVSEEEFLRMSREPGTIVLDARSRAKYDELHISGAVNLSFPDITAASLESLIPAKNTRVLIYCNNNFANNESAFATKAPSASLNLSTYIALYTYGYRNVYELEPLLDVNATTLELVASRQGVIPSVSEEPGGSGGANIEPLRAAHPPGPSLTLGVTERDVP